jgi:predicted Zn-ribbon and HTH transcriptional regulator
VKNRWSGHWLDSKDFNTTERQIGWLFCDDGAGEKADFIHYVEYEGMHLISLIHVKAAKTDSPTRKISVGAHDIVLNQGVKNLRYCSRKTLATDLRERLESASKKECWRDGKKVDPSDFIEALEEINGISKVKNRVIIVQPHTLKKTYTNTKNSKIKRQLDVLLVSAENAIRSSGAEFYLLGFDDSRL